MQVDPIKPKLKPPGSKRLKLKCHTLLSTFAFKVNLRRYSEVFCGSIGNAKRSEYSMIGSVVNLAARLMGKTVNPKP